MIGDSKDMDTRTESQVKRDDIRNMNSLEQDRRIRALEERFPQIEAFPCNDPTCPCCSAHTPLHRRYEDALEEIVVAVAAHPHIPLGCQVSAIAQRGLGRGEPKSTSPSEHFGKDNDE
jgi:hypothetical protein